MTLLMTTLVTAAGHSAQAQSDSARQIFIDSALSRQIREYQALQLTHQRVLLLGMVDSMPERLYRDRTTPAQRDFAQQIHHAANAPAKLVERSLEGPPPDLPDTAIALNTRDGLRGFVNAAFDYLESVFQSQSDADRVRLTTGGKLQRWQAWDMIYAHTMWTGGQIVGNFRKHGMAPPSWSPF